MALESLQSTANQVAGQFNSNVGGSIFTSSAAPLQTNTVSTIIPKSLQLPDWNSYLGSKEARRNSLIQDNLNKFGFYADTQGFATKNPFGNKGDYTFTREDTGSTQEYDALGQNKNTGQIIDSAADAAMDLGNKIGDIFKGDGSTGNLYRKNGKEISKATQFMNSNKGAAVSAAANIVGGAVNKIGDAVGVYSDRPDAQQLNETQESVRSAIYSGVSMIPGWGPLISAGLQLTDGLGKMMGTQMSNISKDAAEDAGLSRGFNNVVATIPGLGSLLGAFAKKTDEFKFDRSRVDNIASAYDMSTFDSAEDLSGGKFLGQGNKVNEYIASQNWKKDIMTGISDTQRLRMSGASAVAADLAQQTKNRYSGITGGQMTIGKHGMKMNLPYVRDLLFKFQKGGKTTPKRRTLEELRVYADSINPRFVQRMNDPNMIGINFIDDEGKPSFGTHCMEVGDDGEGHYYVYPRIQEIDGQLQFYKNWEDALNTALKNKNYLEFDNLEEADNFASNYKDVYPVFQKFKNGGKLGTPGIESNVIVEGAYHAHKNHLDEINPELSEMTPKGIPVATEDESGNKTQVAEIEVGELILTKELTDKLEELYKDGSDEAAIQAGMLFAEEIIDNTVDNKGDVLDEDN